MIRNINYLEITNYQDIIVKEQNNENSQIYNFKLPKIISDLNSVEKKELVAVKLKAKERDLIHSFEYDFSSINHKNIFIDSLNEFSKKLENGKLYLFNGFHYYNNTLYRTNISSIEVIDENSIIENIIFPKNINDIVNNQIINLEGNIKDLIIEEFSVIIEELNTLNKIKIRLDCHLIKKINPNGLCQFISFKKIDNNKYEYTELSNIYPDNNTYIELNFLDINDLYYNRIKVTDNYYINIKQNINKDTLKFKLDSNENNIIFEQKFVYEKVNEKNVIESFYEFILEIKKGCTNRFSSYLKKNGGYSYQLYFQSKIENSLPKKIKLKVDNNNFVEISNFENFGNKLKNRITIINTIKQDFIEINYQDVENSD